MCEHGVEFLNGSSTSRRRLIQLGALPVGGLLIGATAAAAGPTDTTGAGQDGAAAGDPHVGSRTIGPMTAGAAGATSYNGWPVGTPGSAIGVQSYTVTGTSIPIPVKAGDVDCRSAIQRRSPATTGLAGVGL